MHFRLFGIYCTFIISKQIMYSDLCIGYALKASCAFRLDAKTGKQ